MLVADICKRQSIPAANTFGHNSIAPVTRAHCPGNYPMDELRAYVNSQVGGVPIGWTDDGTTLKTPNGMDVVMGFRARVLQGWDATNVPLENERAVTQVEHANPGVGAGSVQTFVNCRLGWTSAKGVYFVPIGDELLFLENH